MKLRVCPSGLKATTRQHGLTEYWSHRITFCSAPVKTYPKIFCWIYRHEGRKLKHELRCHAVICSKEVFCQEIANVLKVIMKMISLIVFSLITSLTLHNCSKIWQLRSASSSVIKLTSRTRD